MKDMMEANLKAKASAKMKLPKNPAIALLICVCWYVLGIGWLTMVMVIVLLNRLLMRVWAAKVCKKKMLVGVRVFTI